MNDWKSWYEKYIELIAVIAITITMIGDIIPADTAAVKPVVTIPTNEEYVVKEGDTLESIVIRFYGSFDMSKVIAIQEANKMANPNALSIGQKLIIPMN